MLAKKVRLPKTDNKSSSFGGVKASPSETQYQRLHLELGLLTRRIPEYAVYRGPAWTVIQTIDQIAAGENEYPPEMLIEVMKQTLAVLRPLIPKTLDEISVQLDRKAVDGDEDYELELENYENSQGQQEFKNYLQQLEKLDRLADSLRSNAVMQTLAGALKRFLGFILLLVSLVLCFGTPAYFGLKITTGLVMPFVVGLSLSTLIGGIITWCRADKNFKQSANSKQLAKSLGGLLSNIDQHLKVDDSKKADQLSVEAIYQKGFLAHARDVEESKKEVSSVPSQTPCIVLPQKLQDSPSKPRTPSQVFALTDPESEEELKNLKRARSPSPSSDSEQSSSGDKEEKRTTVRRRLDFSSTDEYCQYLLGQ